MANKENTPGPNSEGIPEGHKTEDQAADSIIAPDQQSDKPKPVKSEDFLQGIDEGYVVGYAAGQKDALPIPGEPRDFQMDVAREVYRLRTLKAARELAEKEQRQHIELPPVQRLDEFLAIEDDPVSYVMDQVMPCGAHGILAAQYKAGKTTILENLIRSLVDGDPFLGRYAVARDSTVTLIDNELDEAMLRRWLRAQGIRNQHKVKLVSLRGSVSSFNLLDDDLRARWVSRLQDPGVVLLDCLRPILDSLGLDENREAGRFLVAFDEFLKDIGATEAMIVHHMGHNGERSRGDSRLQDWPDMTWKLVRQSPDDPASPRYFSAFGRDVDVPESALLYDEQTKRLTLTDGNRKTMKSAQRIPDVLEFLKSNSGATKTAIREGISGDQKTTVDAIDEAFKNGLITRQDRQGRGGGYIYSLNSGELG